MQNARRAQQQHGACRAWQQPLCGHMWPLLPAPPALHQHSRRAAPPLRSCSAAAPATRTAAAAAPQRLRRARCHASSKAPNSSFDAEEDLDSDLAEELSRFRSRDTWGQVAQHLDLVWQVGRGRGKRSVCGCCQGTGEEECSWCHGTGAMMVGDTLFRSADGASHCPVCKGKGYVPCDNCRGTGYRAAWMQGPDSCKNSLGT